jgi:hypothetical protein
LVGLVQQQHVGPAHQRLRQRHALAVAAGQGADARLGLQVQPVQRFVDALLQFQPSCASIRPCRRRGRPGCGCSVDQVDDVGQRLAHRFEHRAVFVQQRFLGDEGDAQALLALQRRRRRALHAGQDLQQGGLAGAVAADQADALAGLQREIGVVQQGRGRRPVGRRRG